MLKPALKASSLYTAVGERYASLPNFGDPSVAFDRQTSVSRMELYFKHPALTAECRFLEEYITGYERHWK